MDGTVSAGQAPASWIGAQILREGGNAVDAAVAATLAMGVADPANASIAGRCHVLVVQSDGTAAALDGRTALPAVLNAPTEAPPGSGPLVVPVPGNPTTLAEAARRFGRLPWNRLVAPAARLAAEGFAVPPKLGAAWRAAAPGLRQDAGARALFLAADGTAPPPGSRFVQPALARTLEELAAQGPDAMMAGPRAARVLAGLRAQGSTLTQDDFTAYRPLEGELVRATYRGWRVVTIGRQGYGHSLAQTLGILGHFDLAALPQAQRWTVMLLAQAIARQDRPKEEDPAEHLLDPDLHAEQAARLRGFLRDPALARAFLGPPPPLPQQRRGDTTHIAATDGEGRCCAITTSIGPHFGALVAAPEDGFLFAHSYRLAEGDRNAKRDRTEMLPTVLHGPAGERVALGAAGSSRIPGAVIRTIAGIVDLGLGADAAVKAPAAVWHDGRVLVAPEMPPDVPAALQAAGLPAFTFAPAPGQHFGLVHAAAAGPVLSGGADPYWDGAAVHVRDAR